MDMNSFEIGGTCSWHSTMKNTFIFNHLILQKQVQTLPSVLTKILYLKISTHFNNLLNRTGANISSLVFWLIYLPLQLFWSNSHACYM